jgi:hypothetical protein
MAAASMDANTGAGPRIMQPGSNCWRLAHARRLAFLVDADAYFSALRAAFMRARQSIFILGWDVDSRTRLPRSGDEADELPEGLGEFLDALARRRRKLHVRVLDWDFAMLFALDREVLPLYQPGWRGHRRVRFHLRWTAVAVVLSPSRPDASCWDAGLAIAKASSAVPIRPRGVKISFIAVSSKRRPSL